MKYWIRTITFAIALITSASAFAQDDGPTLLPDSGCTTDADCMDGEICEILATDVACAPCPDEGECEPCPEPTSFGYCTPPPPPPCTSDADCAMDEICVSYTYEICSGSGSTGGAVCDPDDETCESMPVEDVPDTGSCTTESESLCVPPYVAPCQIDADCGAGFTCTDVEICECTTEPVPRDGSTDEEPGSNCSCSPTGQNYCELNDTACTTDADCLDGLVCIDFGAGVPSVPCREDENGDVICNEMEPVEPESYCAPVGYDDWGGVAGGPALDRVAEATGAEQDNLSADRIAWGDEGSAGGSKADAGGCSAAGADISVLGLLMLAGMLLRRRRQ